MSESKMKPEVLQEESQALMKSSQGMVSLTRTKTQIEKTLADDNARNILNLTMTTFVNVDMRFHVGMQAIGEVIHNFLTKADEKLQRKWIDAICEFQGIPSIEFNPKAPRSSLALAVFAKYPEMQQQVKGGKDTKGALRLSNYLLAYRNAIEKPRGKKGAGTPEKPVAKPRSASDLFVRLYTAATLKEKQTLISLAGRVGIEYEDWLPEETEEKPNEGTK
jgi:hypothetical protein